MSLPRVCLETSFISYLAAALQQRNSSDVNAAHGQMVSFLWWTKQRGQFDVFISDVVERVRGRSLGSRTASGEADAAHIAFASVYGCDYLLTWNFKHIANALLQPVLYKIIQSYGYQPSLLCTPEQLLTGYGDL